MRILLVNSTCKVGGVSTFMLSLRKALLAGGHGCELFFFEHGSMEPLLPPDCRVHFGSLADCMRLVERQRFTVVHGNNIDWTTGISAARHIGAKLILTAHKARDPVWTYGWRSGNCDALTAVSNGLKTDLQPFTDLRIQVVPNGIDTDRFTPGSRASNSAPIVAWVGRSTAVRKGLDRFAAIAPQLHRAGVRLWVIDQHGADRAAEVLPEAVATLRPLAERWCAVSFDEMPILYQGIAASGGCLVSTSTFEGLPLSLLEAQSCGCTVIASDVCGNNECVSPEAGGILFALEMPAGDLSALVLDAVSDRVKQQARQRDASAYVRARFSLERMAGDYLRIYDESPYQPIPGVKTRIRARTRLSPLLHRSEYLDQRWGVGALQHACSEELAESGDWRLAAGAARAAFETSPTLYVRPQRVAHLVNAHLRATTSALAGHPATSS